MAHNDAGATLTSVESDSGTLSAATSDSLNTPRRQPTVPLPLVCGICGRDYVVPKILPCFHTHCASCLESVVPASSLAINCPKCMLQFILPAGGVAGLMDNALFRQYASQDDPNPNPITITSLQLKKPQDLAAPCLTHADRNLSHYCRTCDKLLCESCTKSDPECLTHKVDSVRDVAKAQRLLLLDLLKKTESSFPTLLTARTKAKASMSSLKQKYVSIRDEIQRLFNDLHTLMAKREHQLNAILEAKFCEKRKALEAQENELSRAIDAYNKTRRFLDSVVLSGSELDVMIAKKEMSDFYATLNSRNLSSVRTNDAIKLTAKFDDLRKQIETFGNVEINNAVAVETCADGGAIKCVHVQEERCFKIQLKDAAAQNVSMPLEEGELLVEVKSPFNDLLPSKLAYAGAGTYNVSYVTEYPGLYEINVKLRGEPIKESPFSVRSLRREAASNGPLPLQPSSINNRNDDRASGSANFHRAFSPASGSSSVHSQASRSTEQTTSTVPSSRSAALLEKTSNGSLLTRSRNALGSSRSALHTGSRKVALSKMSDSSASLSSRRPTPLISSSRSVAPSVASFKLSSTAETESTRSATGKYAAIRVGHRGTNVGQFTNPQGVTFSPSLNALIVADCSNHNVQLFDCRSSNFLRQFGVRGRDDGQLLKPTGVAEYNRNFVHNLLVTDYENKCVNVFESDGRFKERLGEMKVMGPKGIAVDHEGRVLVADYRAGCVCVFSASTKKLIQRVGGRGSADHQLGAPSYVAVNANNDIVVTDFQYRKVKLFSSEGHFLYSFSLASTRNTPSQAAAGPTGVAVDEKGRILVADTASSTIQLFDNNGCFLQYVNTTADPLAGPQGLCITSTSGAVAVADTGSCCVKIYRYQ